MKATQVVKDFDPIASIQRFYDAENEFCRANPDQQDIRLMLNELDPDVVVEVPDSLPHGGTWRGHAGFEELFAAVSKHWQEFVVVYNDAKWHRIDDGRVLTEGILRGVLRATGKRIEMPGVSLFTFTSRGLSHLVHYYKDTAAIVMAGK
jgi:ketosteroid isomerase-like protein